MSPGSPPAFKTVFKAKQKPFELTEVALEDLTESHLQQVLDSRKANTRVLGCAATYDMHQQVESIAIASVQRVLRVTSLRLGIDQLQLLQEHVFQNELMELVGCHMDRVALSIFLDLQLDMSNGIDMQSLFKEKSSNRTSLEIYCAILGGLGAVDKDEVWSVFGEEQTGDVYAKAAMRAWACCRAANREAVEKMILGADRVSTLRDCSDDDRRVSYHTAAYLSHAARQFMLLPKLAGTRINLKL